MTSRAFLAILFAAACTPPDALDADTQVNEDADGDQSTESGDGKSDSISNLPEPNGSPAKHAIVLIHGMGASPTFHGFGEKHAKTLCGDGHRVFIPTLPPFQSTERRAEKLAEYLEGVFSGTHEDACGGALGPVEKVNLIAHSMGGLDARYLVASLGFAGRVASVTTISTPHRGSAMADMAIGLLEEFSERALQAFGKWLGRDISDAGGDADLAASMLSLSERRADRFNDENRDVDGVYYQSWAGLSNVGGAANPKDAAACDHNFALFRSPGTRHVMHALLKVMAFIVAHRFEMAPNDGMVRVESAKWGNFRGCIPADHADEIGALKLTWSRFDHLRFLRNIAFELATKGF